MKHEIFMKKILPVMKKMKHIETHRYPHIFHTENPQLNNIACMLAYIIKNCCYKKFHLRMDEIQEGILKLLENKERYLTLDELSQFLTRGEDKGKTRR